MNFIGHKDLRDPFSSDLLILAYIYIDVNAVLDCGDSQKKAFLAILHKNHAFQIEQNLEIISS